MIAMESLVRVFAQVEDPRKPRGVRHPMESILALVFLGLLARIREMEKLNRWATEHWDQLREPLGFDREEPPHATTISRSLAKCDLSSFARAFQNWIQQVLPPDESFVAAVDAKTSCQGIDTDGDPVQLVTVLIHNFKVVIGQWSVRGEKTNESGVLKHHLAELKRDFPLLKLITGDAIYANRPLAEVLLDNDCDYLLQIKGNQKDIQEALEVCLGAAHETRPAAQTIEKKGTLSNAAGCGLI
jgi:hypothetical protein